MSNNDKKIKYGKKQVNSFTFVLNVNVRDGNTADKMCASAFLVGCSSNFSKQIKKGLVMIIEECNGWINVIIFFINV